MKSEGWVVMPRVEHVGAEAVYGTASKLVESCLLRDDSLFTEGMTIWSTENIEEFYHRFTDLPDTSKDDFETKLQRQLEGANPAVIQLVGELLFFHFLISDDLRGSTKRDRIETVLNWSPTPVSIPSELSEVLEHGIVSAGTSFRMNRYSQISYLLEFLKRLKETPQVDRSILLGNPQAFKELAYTVPLHSAYTQRFALLHLVHPDTFEAIVSRGMRAQIISAFGELVTKTTDDNDEKLSQIRASLTEEIGHKFEFWDKEIEERWNPEDKTSEVDEVEAPLSSAITWWVNQGSSYARALAGGFVFAPLKTKGNTEAQHHKNVSRMKMDETVLGYANGAIRAIGRVTREAEVEPMPQGIDTRWDGEGYLAQVKFLELANPISLQEIPPEIRQREAGPFTRVKGVKQGYMYELSADASLKLCKLFHDRWPQGSPWCFPKGISSPDLMVPEAVSMEWLISETLWTRQDLEELIEAVLEAKQVVLAGPPGTSKTWVAERVARYITHGDENAVRKVQFHPSYGYEEFIGGLRPVINEDKHLTFDVRPGVVLEIVERMKNSDQRHVLVIDEMNRANLSRVFGELMYLFENRCTPIDLQYTSGFELPKELLFIGTMNTADRSIRSIDIALRRRFEVFECQPDSEILEKYFEDPDRTNDVSNLIPGFIALNEALTDSIDRHRNIGHTFFMHKHMTRARLNAIWRRKIGPLIEEYFFDQPDLATEFKVERFWPED